MKGPWSTNDTSNETEPGPPDRERFLVDSDCDPGLVRLLRAVGFTAKSVLKISVPNDDTRLLVWARARGYILVCHDKHRDAPTKYAFHSEMYYRGGKVIRVGGRPGQDPLLSLGMILTHMPSWREHFQRDSVEAVVHVNGCRFVSAERLFDHSRYKLKLTFDDPAVRVRERAEPKSLASRRRRVPSREQLPLDRPSPTTETSEE